MYEDKILKCKECGNEFVFTAGEQEARDVQKRLDYTAEQRKAENPFSGDDNTVYAEGISDNVNRDDVKYSRFINQNSTDEERTELLSRETINVVEVDDLELSKDLLRALNEGIGIRGLKSSFVKLASDLNLLKMYQNKDVKFLLDSLIQE